MSERQGIEIDYCPQCRGVWLDRGELDKIIERSAREAAPVQQAPQAQQTQPYPAQDRDHYRKDSHDGYGKKRKRESFLEMLFD